MNVRDQPLAHDFWQIVPALGRVVPDMGMKASKSRTCLPYRAAPKAPPGEIA